MKIKKPITTYEEIYLTDAEITLPISTEIESLIEDDEDRINFYPYKPIAGFWTQEDKEKYKYKDYWLCKDCWNGCATCFDDEGNSSSLSLDTKLGIRPIIKVPDFEAKGLKVGDNFKVHGESWTVLSNTIALCDVIIGVCSFNEYPEWLNDWKRRTNCYNV